MEVKLKIEGSYKNHNVSNNQAVNLTFKLAYTELPNYIKSLQMLNENVTVAAKIGTEKPVKLGTFMIKNLAIDNDGEGTLKLNSQMDHVDANVINEVAMKSDEPLFLMLKADIEDVDEENLEDESE